MSEERTPILRLFPVGLATLTAVIAALFLAALSAIILNSLGVIGLVIMVGTAAAGAVVVRDVLRRRPISS